MISEAEDLAESPWSGWNKTTAGIQFFRNMCRNLQMLWRLNSGFLTIAACEYGEIASEIDFYLLVIST